MAFKNVGTYNLDKAVSGSAGAANAGAFTMDAAGIASGQDRRSSRLNLRSVIRSFGHRSQASHTQEISRSVLAAAGQSLFPRCRWVTASLEAPGIT